MKSYPEKRRAALEAAMRTEVYEVAARVISEEGLDALTMDRLAREIGVSRGTLYNYFDDADDVLNFVEARAFTPVAEGADRIAAGDLAPADKLEALARHLLDALYRNRTLAMALFAKQKLHGRRAEQKMRNREHFLRLFRTVVGEGIASGAFRDVAPPLAAEIFSGAITGVIDTMMYTGEVKPADELVPGLIDILVNGLAAEDGGAG